MIENLHRCGVIVDSESIDFEVSLMNGEIILETLIYKFYPSTAIGFRQFRVAAEMNSSFLLFYPFKLSLRHYAHR